MTQGQVSQMFNAIAKSYDRVNRILSFGIDQRWRKLLASYLPEKENLRLLDLATGTCDQLLTLMETEKVVEALGIDLAEEMLSLGREKVAATSYANQVELKVASALEIPVSENSFDCVTISFGIRNVQGNCLEEIFRVLAPGGRALILEFSLPENRLVRSMHLLYLRKILPLVGGFVSKEKSAYNYLNKTIESYPYGEKFLQMMEKEGFVDFKAIPLTLGVATLYVGEKP
ncbi:MAG: bifunctional demethylmenaquinone methyltransferase/2-methoxy-6-polyprenyl-1,4-benzoquinol methylase UbiE [Simkaniaceae bacterium]|nr:bifunctional demethylmenaquinone methyltransferase/2-methoxy-6-polyprenyl-1,4-benzoquinol methylase UbiE [Candidatus Sacchlamyda saccharinae]